MKFDPWELLVRFPNPSAASWIRCRKNYVSKFKMVYNQPSFSSKISRITLIKNGFQMWWRKKNRSTRNCHSSKDLLQLSPSSSTLWQKTDLILCVQIPKSHPYVVRLLRQKMRPFSSVGNRGWNRSHIRTTSFTYKEELIEKEASLGTLYELFKKYAGRC